MATDRHFDRRRTIAAIHAAATQADIDEETRRAMQARISAEHGPACESCSAMTDRQLAAVLAHLNSFSGRGFDVQQDRPAAKSMTERPLLRKIGALLADGRKPWSYGHEVGERMGGGERLEFCRDDVLRKVVSALVYDQKRRKAAAPTTKRKSP